MPAGRRRRDVAYIRPCFVKTPVQRRRLDVRSKALLPSASVFQHISHFTPPPISTQSYSPNRQIRAGVPRVEWKWTARFVICSIVCLASVQNDYLFPAARQNENNFLHSSHITPKVSKLAKKNIYAYI